MPLKARFHWLVLLLVAVLAPALNGFIAPQPHHHVHNEKSTKSSPPIILSASSSSDDREHNNKGQLSLYDILGASPLDTQEELKKKYNKLVRQLHPDAVGKSSLARLDKTDLPEFSDITAAWRVLSNAKDRKRYDRELRAKEFTENLGTMLEVGIRTAVPFLKKTANSTIAAVETSSNAMQDMGQKMGNAMEVFELEQKSRNLEQQAAKETARAEQMQTQLATQEERRLEQLRTPNAELTSSQALQLLKRFNTPLPKSNEKDLIDTKHKDLIMTDIATLEQVESEYKEKKRSYQVLQANVDIAERDAANAVLAEQIALEKLESAKRELAQARSTIDTATKAAKNATQHSKVASVELDKVSVSLGKRTELVRTALKQQEGESLKREAVFLKQESALLKENAKTLRANAQEIKVQSEELKRQQKKREQKQQARQGEK